MRAYWQSFRYTLAMMLERPLWMMMLLTLSLTSMVYFNGSVWNLPVGIVDQDHSSASRQISRSLNNTSKIETRSYNNLPEAQRDLGARKLFAVIILPQDMEKKILSGESVVIPAFGDATNRLSNMQIQQGVMDAYQSMVTRYNSSILQNSGFSPAQAKVLLTPINGELRDLFNPGTSFAAITFPGMLVMLFQHTLLIASTRFSLLLHSRMEGNVPLPVHLGGLSALSIIWLFLSVVMFTLWPWLLGYRQTAPIPELLLLTFPFLLAVLGLGKLIAECLTSVESIYLTLSFVTTPVYYISGTLWPLQAMPAGVRFIAHMLPSTWATKMIAGVNQMDLRISEVWPDIAMLLLLGAFYALLGVGIGRLRKRGFRRQISDVR